MYYAEFYPDGKIGVGEPKRIEFTIKKERDEYVRGAQELQLKVFGKFFVVAGDDRKK